MKRSEINAAIKRMEEITARFSFSLPKFCSFTPQMWQRLGSEYDEIRENMLGWDITDYGLGDFKKTGFTLITLRNGNLQTGHKKPYAEKLLFLEESQYSPMHFHTYKMEDIINRGGGNILIRVYNSTPDFKLADTDVEVDSDGRKYTVKAGTQIRLTPGESITIHQGMYHDFTVEEGFGEVLLGEVSMCNDDNTDNHFYENVGRFPAIEEDEPAYRLLCNEYPKAK